MPRATVPDVESLTPPRSHGGLLFQQPDPSPFDRPSPSDLPTSPSPLDDSPSPSDELRDELPDGPSDADPTSSTASSGSRPSATSQRVLRDGIRGAVEGVSVLAHDNLTRDDAERELGLYLADDDDVQAIADPLASIANRRGGIGAAGNPDVGDAIAAAIGLAIYATKQLRRWRDARTLRKAVTVAAAGPVDGEQA